MLFLDHIWIIPLLPALGAMLMFFFGRKLQKSSVSAICVGVVVLAFVIACAGVLEYTVWYSQPSHFHQPYETVLYSWLGSGTGQLTFTTHDGTANFQADAGFLLDSARPRKIFRADV